MDTIDVNFKEEGNKAFKSGDFMKAIEFYTKGLKICDNDSEKQTLYKNRAAAFLKNDDYDSVIADCTKALELSPRDPKALYRRGVAYDAQENYEKAYADIRTAQSVDPKNKDIMTLLHKLHLIVQQKVEQNSQLGGKVNQVFEILFDITKDTQSRETAANNLLVLTKDKTGADKLVEDGLIQRLSQLMKNEKNSAVRLSCTRALSEICKQTCHAMRLLHELGLSWVINMLNSPEESQINAAQYTVQTIISTLTGYDKETQKCKKNLIEEHLKEIDSIMIILVSSITNRTLDPKARDAVIEIVCRNVDYKLLDWAEKFIRIDGLEKLMEVAIELPEYKYESSIDTTENTNVIISACLVKLYEAQYSDKQKAKFVDRIDEFIKIRLLAPEEKSKVQVGVLITTLLYGPLDVGNNIIGREGILEMFLVMAQSGEEVQQRIACETLIAAASKKDKCQAILAKGTDILKELYKSSNDSIKVRALVGLCKLGSLGGSDASLRPFAKEGAGLKLAEACRRFLLNPNKDQDMRRWACEGLSYLTLDAEIKEKLIDDRPALRSIIELAKTGNKNCLYGIITTFVNLCNAYDKQEIIPEMIELAKFSKQHIPEEHELDDKDFVDKRVLILAEEGAASALVALSKTESNNIKELIARIFNAICEAEQNRGVVVAQGGIKALLDLSSEGTAKGKICACQAIARIGITMDPAVAFPGQRAYEVVRPILKLLAVDNTGLENFEGLMALCNIAGISESTRQRIIKEGGLAKLEHYSFEPHELIRRAAFQATTNMCASPDFVKTLEGKNDKFKYLFLCCADEDIEIVKAAGGGICMALGINNTLCPKIFEAADWEDNLKFMLSHGDKDVQLRGIVIVDVLVRYCKDFAIKIMDTHCKDAITALAQIENPEFVLPRTKEMCNEIISHCIGLGIIAKEEK